MYLFPGSGSANSPSTNSRGSSWPRYFTMLSAKQTLCSVDDQPHKVNPRLDREPVVVHYWYPVLKFEDPKTSTDDITSFR